jgi:hypothetical protein
VGLPKSGWWIMTCSLWWRQGLSPIFSNHPNSYNWCFLNSSHVSMHKMKCNPPWLKAFPDGQQRALHYRYKVSPKEKVNAYKPKELEGGIDRANLRSAQLGAIFHQKYSQLPRCEWCNVMWEVGPFWKDPKSFPYGFKSYTVEWYHAQKIHLNWG